MTRIFLLAAVASVLASPAFAEADFESPEKAVKFDRERLGDSAYVQALYADIEIAAEQVCEKQFKHSWQRHHFTPKCLKISVERAVAEVDSPYLTDYAQGRRDGSAYVSK